MKSRERDTCKGWKSVDGGPWYVKEAPHREPDGNVCANSLLYARGNFYSRANGKCFNRKDNVEFCKKEDYEVDAQMNPCSPNCKQGSSKVTCIDITTDAGKIRFKNG